MRLYYQTNICQFGTSCKINSSLSGKYVHTTNLELKAKNENHFLISCYMNIIQPSSSGIGTQKLGFREYLPTLRIQLRKIYIHVYLGFSKIRFEI